MSIKNIYVKILDVMREVDYIQKGDKKVNNQYRFVSHDQVASVMHKQFVKHGIVCLPDVVEYHQDGNRTVVELLVRFVNVDDTSDYAEVTALGHGIDSGDKGPGKAVSYAFKYALLKVFCLETGDDPDNDASALYIPSKESVSQDQVMTLSKAIGGHEELLEKILAAYGIDKLSSLPAKEYERVMCGIQKHKEDKL